MELLTERHAEEIAGVLSCYDRILIQGTLLRLCRRGHDALSEGSAHIRIFDYPG
jgi:hypothetical protein